LAIFSEKMGVLWQNTDGIFPFYFYFSHFDPKKHWSHLGKALKSALTHQNQLHDRNIKWYSIIESFCKELNIFPFWTHCVLWTYDPLYFYFFCHDQGFFLHFWYKKIGLFFSKSSKYSVIYTRKPKKIPNFCGKKNLLEKETLIMTH